ncbi:DUF4129 domain-containing protein [Halobium salinum]|uniref:DUF4129 domain-containing protein n=1 Tax=Halobium salinum TaxID=1364940 RepID=A0ABD5PB82_9EURY|nr:DUF4129 domain-containing protein [Halobium salinum]
MNGDRLVAALVAVACVSAMGVASTTLDSSLKTDPDDVINLDWEELPIGGDRAVQIQEEIEGNQQRQQQQVSQSQQQQQQQQEEEEQQEQETTPAEQSLLEQLWDLLLALLPYLVATLLLVAGGLLLRRYWERVVGPLLALLPSAADGEREEARPDWQDRTPRNEAERAWFDLVREAGVERPHAKTPSEAAQAAVDAGFDPDAVERLRRTFEEVRYGGRGMTDDQRERIQGALSRLGSAGGRSGRQGGRGGAVTDGGAASDGRETGDGGAATNGRETGDGGAASDGREAASGGSTGDDGGERR